jgi:hypothetical protein
MVNPKSHESAKKIKIERTKIPLALFPKHPALILELKSISENGKSFWAGRNSAPRAS